ncbi:MAG: pantoate--beta-alanine ligase [Synergistaceae bacterium]|nr:pantoate--beta-alanine ligase [Synergistaceae bacterium]
MLRIDGNVEKLRRAVRGLRQEGGTVGFVPTMGYLHEGHLSLVRKSVSENQTTVVSIFVNPLQFGPNEDYEAYPRDLEKDCMLLEKEGVDLVYCPKPEDLYHPDHSTYVVEEGVSRDLCGASRPGHFRGVCTVVLKLFHLVEPDRAYFGEKDYQQLQVIRRMVRDLNVPVEIRGCPIVREQDGLALSSRNVYLSPPERASALALSRSLKKAKALYDSGERDAAKIAGCVREELKGDPSLYVEYVEVKDASELSALKTIERPAVLALAVRVGKTRLIDNVILGEGNP